MSLKVKVCPVIRADGEDVAIAIGFFAEGDRMREANVIKLSQAIKLRESLDEMLDEVIEGVPEVAAKVVSKDICDNPECERCAPLYDFIGEIVERTGLCPTHGVKLADGLGCPLCDQMLADTGETF